MVHRAIDGDTRGRSRAHATPLFAALRPGLTRALCALVLTFGACGDDESSLTDIAPGDTGGDVSNGVDTTTDTSIEPDLVDTADVATDTEDAAVDTFQPDTNPAACVPACSDGHVCVNGLCACPAGQDECEGVCVDLARDPLNCGGCGRAAQLEICNGQDDDCDGATDEDLSPPAAPCEIQNALGTCAGTWTCTVNGFACDAKTPLPEACNGQDDDCNGVTDDGFVDNTGAYTADRACGSCANDCTTLLAKDHAYGICNSGGLAPTCQLVCCAAGDGNARCDGTTWQDANGQPGDGCEAEVVQACTDESQCQQSEICLGQRCTPNPQGGTCDTTADCALGDVCVGGICGCAGEQYTAEAVPPNVLIIFDRTSSMNQSAGNGQTKLQVAVAAVTQITADYDDRMRFGLLAYPATNQAGNQGEQCGAGSVFIAPALNNGPAIGAWLANVGTTNLGTPTAAALQVAIDYPGIKDPTRDNIAILITDGESSCADPVPKVTELFNLSPSVKTYVIGFGGGVDPDELNDMAVQGGTALDGATKYYDASTPATLGAALETITGDLLDCEYLLGRVPPNIEGLDVYFDRALQSLDPTHLDGWDYDAATNRLTFYGPSCQSLLEGQIDDLVFIYGCPNPIIIGSP